MLHSSGGMTISAQHSQPPCPPKTMVSRATAITESRSTALKPAMFACRSATSMLLNSHSNTWDVSMATYHGLSSC